MDATPLLASPTGVGGFTRALLDGLASDADVEPVAFALSWRGRGRLSSVVPPGVEVVRRPLPARPLRLAWLRSELPRLAWLVGRHDLVHGPNFVAPPSASPRLVTVHDLTPVHHPELCTPDTRSYPTLVRRAIERGAWVHTVSEFVRAEVIEHFPVDPARVVTVPNAVAPSAGGDAAAGRRLAGSDTYVLALGTLEPRKDLPGLVAAFDRLAAGREGARLVLAGPDGWGTAEVEAAIEAADHGDRVRRLGYVDDRRRRDLLAGAALFAYPSRYEGFGLPPLEAMSAGTPVVTTTAGALREVAAEGALQVEAGDVGALAAALERVLDDPDLRRQLVDRGHRTVARYPPERMISGIVELYRRVLAA